MAMFSDDFEDGDLSEWTTSTTSNADVQLDGGRMRLRVYKCNTAIAERDLGTLDGTLTVSFDWENLAEQWYEGTDWQLLDGDGGAIEYELVEGTDVRSPGHRGNRSGTVTAEATVDGPVTLQFVVRPSSHCSNFDHANTYLWIDNVEVDASNVAVPTGLVWDVPIDWDSTVDSSGVVHEAVANTDHVDAGVVKQGYSVATPYRKSDLLAYLPFHDDGGSTTSDFSPHANDATVNGPTPNRAGPLGTTGYEIDGSNDRVLLQDLPLYDMPASGSVTHNVWYRTSSSSIMFPLYLRGAQGDGSAHLMGVNDDSVAGSEPGSLRFMVRSNSENSSAIVDHGGEIYDGKWHMLTLVYNPTNGVTGYFDGTVVATSSTTMSEDLTFDYLGIGAGPDFTINPNWFDGTLWDYRYYGDALSPSEIQALYDVATTPGRITTDRREVPE